jgi:hypothetical protein
MRLRENGIEYHAPLPNHTVVPGLNAPFPLGAIAGPRAVNLLSISERKDFAKSGRPEGFKVVRWSLSANPCEERVIRSSRKF